MVHEKILSHRTDKVKAGAKREHTHYKQHDWVCPGPYPITAAMQCDQMYHLGEDEICAHFWMMASVLMCVVGGKRVSQMHSHNCSDNPSGKELTSRSILDSRSFRLGLGNNVCIGVILHLDHKVTVLLKLGVAKDPIQCSFQVTVLIKQNMFTMYAVLRPHYILAMWARMSGSEGRKPEPNSPKCLLRKKLWLHIWNVLGIPQVSQLRSVTRFTGEKILSSRSAFQKLISVFVSAGWCW